MRRCATTLAAEMRPEEHELLLAVLRSVPPEGRCLEVGTAAGGTLVRMLACRDPQNEAKFVVVDPMKYFPRQLETVKRNLREHGLIRPAPSFASRPAPRPLRPPRAVARPFASS